MSRKSIIKGIIALLGLAAAAAFFVVFAMNDFVGDPVARQVFNATKEWRREIDLNEYPFLYGTMEMDMRKALRGYGYSRVESGTQTYEKIGARYPCRIRVTVKVTFDGSEKLTLAKGALNEAGCL